MEKKFMDVLMVFPSGGTYFISNFYYNLGSSYIIAYLIKNGFNAMQFISNQSLNVKGCVNKIINYNPKIVGFTVYDTNFMQCILICNGLKAINSKIIIVFGGPTPTVQSKEILENNHNVDICVRGEGEEILLELLYTLSTNNFDLNKVDLDNIKGITFRKKKKIIINADSNILLSNKLIKNYLDKYPSPYLSKVINASEAFPIGIITARGCNQNCVFCNCAVLSKKNIFTHSIKRVIEELRYISEYKKHRGPIPFNDDGFTIIPRRAKEICESIIENDIKLRLACITRCDKVDEELLDLMKEAGFVSIGFSLESAVPRVLRAIGKVNPPRGNFSLNYNKEIEFIERLKNMTTYAKKIGMEQVFVSIMVGLPGETLQDAQKTIRMVNQLDIDFYEHNNFSIFKGTPIYQYYREYGYKIKPIGRKNNILIHNTFPFDIYKIKMAPKSATEKNSKIIDYNTLKILSLNPKRKTPKPFFQNIIICSNIIKQSLVMWMQQNLAINGTIIHLYSNKINYIKHYKKNLSTLYNEFSPTMYYEAYYWENLNDISILKSGRMIYFGEQIGLLIEIKNTNSFLEEFKKEVNNIENVLCVENNITDIESTYNLLMEISNSGDCFKYLLNSKPLPNFQNICKWTTDQANCKRLETVIIGNDDSIRICWYSDPLGKVGTSFSDIIKNLHHLEEENIKIRNCNGCIRNENCVKCLFPYPLSIEEYCEFKNKNNTNEPAKFINYFNIFKDILFNPITVFNF